MDAPSASTRPRTLAREEAAAEAAPEAMAVVDTAVARTEALPCRVWPTVRRSSPTECRLCTDSRTAEDTHPMSLAMGLLNKVSETRQGVGVEQRQDAY